MQHTLGDAVIRIPDSFRDDSDYAYASPDESSILRVVPVPEAADAHGALESTKTEFFKYYGSGVVYCNPARLRAGPNVATDGYEGELLDAIAGAKRRFGLFAVQDGDTKVTFVLTSAIPKFVSELQRLFASVRFLGDVLDPSLPSAAGFARRQADRVSFEILPDWTCPTSLRFVERSAEAVTVRLTLDEPFVALGTFAWADEIPVAKGDSAAVLDETKTPDRPRPGSWTIEVLVRHQRAGKTVDVALRKACIGIRGGATLTMYGMAPESSADKLSAAWEMMLQTVTERNP